MGRGASGYVGPMQATPRRLGRRSGQNGVSNLQAHQLLAAGPGKRIGAPPSFEHPGEHTARLPPARRLLRRIRVIRRALVIISWTGFCGVVQSALLGMPGRGKARFARTYWSVVCRLLGLQVRVLGHAAGTRRRPPGRLRLQPLLVARRAGAGWPIAGLLRLQGRCQPLAGGRPGRPPRPHHLRQPPARHHRARARRDAPPARRRRRPDPVSRGHQFGRRPGCSPSTPSFFAAAKPSGIQGTDAIRPLVQPVSVVYDRLAGLPVNHARRPVFSWYGDMDLASHFWQLAQWRTMRATILLHAPLDPANYPTRKELAQATWDAVAAGAAELRQKSTHSRADGLSRTGRCLRCR